MTARPATPQTAEEWRPVVGYEGIYAVSDRGRVRRIGASTGRAPGRGGGARVGHILRLQLDAHGYFAVNLWRDGRARRFLVHRLVAAAFLGPEPPGYEVNHRDGVKTNCQLSNLEYSTRSQNGQHAYRIGLNRPHAPKGERHGNAKLTGSDVLEIRRLYRPGEYETPRLAREFGVNVKTINQIVNRKTWRHI
jgi:HNH endonuclease/NUMOD4 motif